MCFCLYYEFCQATFHICVIFFFFHDTLTVHGIVKLPAVSLLVEGNSFGCYRIVSHNSENQFFSFINLAAECFD